MRRATPADGERISEIDLLLFDNGFNERTIGIEIELGECWVEGEPIIGYVLTRRDGTVTDITRLAVQADRQKEGVGERLLLVALTTPGPHMLTVKRDNMQALRLYKKNGFEIAGVLPSGSWIMRREIKKGGN